jgi:hypothetical protein
MSDPKEREALIEAAATAFRSMSPHGDIRTHPAWEDLDEEGRKEAFLLSTKLRQLEAALDQDGLSTTAKAVLQKIKKR